MKAGKAVYQVKCEAERNRDVWEIDVCKRNDQKCEVLKIADRMIKTNQVIIGKQCIRNKNRRLEVIDGDQKIARKRYHDKFLNNNRFSEVDTVRSVHRLIEKNLIGESSSKIKNGKAAGPAGFVSEW